MQPGLFLFWIGPVLIIAGIVLMAVQILRRGRLSDAHRIGPTKAGVTLEPRGQVRAFNPKAHWLSLLLIVLGIILMLVETAS